jgi:site-specific DNA recombinase
MVMKSVSPTPMRCAIYTRKSSEHNLDLAFNSLDAQREACEAYIKSQAHEGWRPLRENYDDGGLSGASLDRPALQRLLSDVRRGGIDIIVVYKVDRLTRSLADFAKLVEIFDAHAVSFVSITQSFNTTSSMGRLTLNVLLSFAQFEREVIGERVRDKIDASKRKGIWVGGPVPIGYRVADKKLVVVPEEATVVRTIFERYLEVGSIRLLADDLAKRGMSPRRRTITDRGPPAVTRFMVGPLNHILRNRCYIGEVAWRGEVHAAEHEPLLDRALFDAVQQRLRDGAVHHTRARSSSEAVSPLMGLLFDDDSNRMTPSHANKKGVRYRYYVSQAVLQGGCRERLAVTRVAAPDVENLVLAAIRERGPGGSEELADRALVVAHVKRIVMYPDAIEMTFQDTRRGPGSDEAGDGSDASPFASETQTDDPSRATPDPGRKPDVLRIPWDGVKGRARRGLASEPASAMPLNARSRTSLLRAIGKARAWMNDLTDDRAVSFADIAKQEGKVERHVRLLAPLAFVSPRIIAAIVEGGLPNGLTVTSLARGLPNSWTDQERRLGLV